MTAIETERERLRQLRGYYGHLKRADMRTRTDLGETYLGERKRTCLALLLKETERDIEETNSRICSMVAEAAAARRNGVGRRALRVRASEDGTPAEASSGPGGRR